ncbi:hypothetical protein [Paenibacillus sp. OK076]|nr:hypothetical protein [Paenibacillus sp. OK076]SEP33675.1 hypothetical protein SAMN05518670_6614 [Paenibacillus sp. OK076]
MVLPFQRGGLMKSVAARSVHDAAMPSPNLPVGFDLGSVRGVKRGTGT